MKVHNTKNAPSPIGPYNQAIESNGILFISGQIAIDPDTSQLKVENIEIETNQVMKNIKSILNSRNLGFDNIIKCSIFLSDMDLFSTVNEIYGGYFTDHFPARECVAVKTLPKNVNVEISVIAEV